MIQTNVSVILLIFVIFYVCDSSKIVIQHSFDSFLAFVLWIEPLLCASASYQLEML